MQSKFLSYSGDSGEHLIRDARNTYAFGLETRKIIKDNHTQQTDRMGNLDHEQDTRFHALAEQVASMTAAMNKVLAALQVALPEAMSRVRN